MLSGEVTHRGEGVREPRIVDLDADLVVVGGGMAGVCCAITAARAGARVVLVQDRPVLGGNASSEVRVFVVGAAQSGAGNNRWAREGGVLDEILVENTFRNPDGNPVLFDTVLLEKVTAEPNVTLLLNTAVLEARMSGHRIQEAVAFCAQNATRYVLRAPLFCDSSGDGILAFLAGASFRMGAEAQDEFGEGMAPPDEYGALLGHTIFFYVKDAGRPVRFIAPAFALDDISATRAPDKIREAVRITRRLHQGALLNWIEYGGRFDTVHDTEEIKWELWRIVYGIWDFVKNSGEFPFADNLTLEWVGTIPGKRESRRFEGHYMLRQHDIVEQTPHSDAVAYGGWSIDLHPGDGVYSTHPAETFLWPRGVYQIPYRCLISRDVENLFLAGRVISASHIAFASTRVMATCAHTGQAVGMAAAICAREAIAPADLLAPARIRLLQRDLLRSGQHIPGVPLHDEDDLVRHAVITASSELLLDDLPADGPARRLDRSHAQLIPVTPGRAPAVTFRVDVTAATRLRAEIRRAVHPDNHSPEMLLDAQEFDLAPGRGQDVTIDSMVDVDTSRYLAYCLTANPHVAVHTSRRRVTGLLATYHRETQEAAADLGRPRLELWSPVGGPYWVPDPEQTHGTNLAVRIDPPLTVFGPHGIRTGYARPTSQPNAWVASPDDPVPTLRLRWSTPRTIREIHLGFDTDFDHPMLSVVAVHPEAAMPFCVRAYRLHANGQVIAEQHDNHQTRAIHRLPEPVHTRELTLRILETNGDTPPAVLEIRAYG